MPVAPPAPLPVSDAWPGFDSSDDGSEVEVVALNGPSLETIGFFQKAKLESYLPAVDGQENWWDIQDVAATNDLTDLLWEIDMKKPGHLQRFMHYLNEDYPRPQGERFHRICRRTGPLAAPSGRPVRVVLIPPTPPGFKSAFMIGKYKGKKLKGTQAAALVRDPTLGFGKPVLTRAEALKSPSARALVSRVKAEIKLW